MVNAPKKNLSPLPAGKYGKSTKQSTQQRHQANEGKRGLEAERVRALGALRSLRSKKKLAAEKKQETHFLSNEEKEQWIDNYVERETAVARKRVEDAETAIEQRQEDMSNVEKAGLTTREPERTFEEMLNAIGDGLSTLASSDNEEDAEDEEEDDDTERGKLSEDDEPGWVMGTISKLLQCRMERFWQKQMKLDESTQPGWGDAADYFRERDMKYGTSELKVPAIMKSQTDYVAAPPSPTTFGELLETLDIVPGISPMPQCTSRPGSSHMRVGSGKPKSPARISSFPPGAESNSSLMTYAMPVQPVSAYHCILPPELITILKSDSDEEMVTAPASAEE